MVEKPAETKQKPVVLLEDDVARLQARISDLMVQHLKQAGMTAISDGESIMQVDQASTEQLTDYINQRSFTSLIGHSKWKREDLVSARVLRDVRESVRTFDIMDEKYLLKLFDMACETTLEWYVKSSRFLPARDPKLAEQMLAADPESGQMSQTRKLLADELKKAFHEVAGQMTGQAPAR